MSYEIIRYDEAERLDNSGSNWQFWKPRTTLILKSSGWWPYIQGEIPKPEKFEEKAKWEEMDAKILTLIILNIAPNTQAGLDLSSAKSAWECLLNRYEKQDPIAQNIAYRQLMTKKFIDGGEETLPTHLAELQRMREACQSVGLTIPDSQFSGTITISMPTPSWDGVIGMLSGIIDPHTIINRLTTEWTRRTELLHASNTSSSMTFNTTRLVPRCENCQRLGHTIAACWDKGGGRAGQYPPWHKGRHEDRSSAFTPMNPKSSEEPKLVWTTVYAGTNTNVWVGDSASTIHIARNRSDFSTYHEKAQVIKSFDNREVCTAGYGDINIKLCAEGRTTDVTLSNVLHVPSATSCILSLKVLALKGFESRLLGHKLTILHNEKVIGQGTLGQELYEMNIQVNSADRDTTMVAVQRGNDATSLETWHRRLGHLGDSTLWRMIGSNVVKGMVVTNSQLNGICENCIPGKMDEKLLNHRQARDTQLFGTLHLDLFGPMEPAARWTQAKYALTVQDEHSSFGFAFTLRSKEEAVTVLKRLDNAIETKFGRRIHTFRSDNDGEFINKRMKEHCDTRGIKQLTSVPHHPWMNNIAERYNRAIIEGTRTMLKDSDLDRDMWGQALLTHIYVRNRCPSSITPGHITPYETVHGHPPSIAHLRVFGTKCFSKLGDKEVECRLIGYDGDDIYITVDRNRKKMRTRNVIFVEGPPRRTATTVIIPNESLRSDEMLDEDGHAPAAEDISEPVQEEEAREPQRGRRSMVEIWGSQPTRRSSRERRPSEKIREMEGRTLMTGPTPQAVDKDGRIARTYAEAVKSPDTRTREGVHSGQGKRSGYIHEKSSGLGVRGRTASLRGSVKI